MDPTDPQLRVFAYAVAEKASLYVAVVDALMAAKERFTLQLRPAEVARELATETDVGDVADVLEALEGWGNVTKFYDTAAPDTLDQFYAKRFLYQLTEAGVAAHEGVRAVRRAGLDTGRLSAVLLPGIQERLEAIRAEAAGDEPDAARLYNALIDLFATFATLADNAARYMQDLAVETSAIAADDERFASYKRAVFMYLHEFVAHLAEDVPAIAALVIELDDDMPRVLELAASADATPTAGDEDTLQRRFGERWAGVRAWFAAAADEDPIVASLRRAMLDAINRILAALDRLHERHLRRVTREADFTQLARWLAVVDGEGARLLWDRAFGLYPARHFSELAGEEAEERGRTSSRPHPRRWHPGCGRGAHGPARAGRARRPTTRRPRPPAWQGSGPSGDAWTRPWAAWPPARRRASPSSVHSTPTSSSSSWRCCPPRWGPGPTTTAPGGHRPRVTVTMRPFPKAARQARIVTPHGTFSCADQWLEIDLADRARRQALA